MAGRIVVFGATGYTGRLIAEALVAAGADPVLAGRDHARLAAVAEELGGLQTRRADAFRQNGLASLVGRGDVLVSTVGPFAKYGDAAIRAAIGAGAVYLDSTGEPAWIRRVHEQYGGPARDRACALLTAMGYDYVPGALAGALALERAGEDAVRVDVGYFALGARGASATAGTKESLVGAALEAGHAFRGGSLRRERAGARVRSFAAAGREREALSIGGAEHFALPAAYPRLREVGVFIGGLGPLTRALQAVSLGASLATRLPGARPLLRTAAERAAELAPTRTRENASRLHTCVVAEAQDAEGRPLTTVSVGGADPYDFTGRFMAWAARRAAGGGVEGTGALSPVTAFGLDALREGCAEAGIATSDS